MSTPFADVVWIRLEKPSFDLIGVILSSLGITGICIGVALALGGCWGYLLIRRARREYDPELELGLSARAR